PKTPEYFFWSSSEYVDENGGHNGWAISFRHGLVGPYHSNFMRDAHVRLVSTLTSAKTLINTWYAGTSYIGTVTTQGVTWHCSDGICKLSGEYGTGLNMAACKMLSSKVGGLSFYYDETGMTWSTTQNSALLEECNSH
ncbi:hypothetical protein, partial [Methylophaga sp.]|uniref:hypothetical protein n=1 Tax=Methylophaga sp. TaxID=2024840 RepID=UPI0027214988